MSEVIASTYEIIEKIGSGGGGIVYLANHLRLGKKVVLKADKRKITTHPELLRREVDILKELSHSYIPQVYDFFVEDETVYTVMDYIEGESLDKPLKRGEKFSQPQVIKWAKQLLEALCYLHSPTHGNPPRGYVHSDIKPANLMRTPYGNVCLIDFNIALALGEENVIGRSAGYASPEHYGLDFSSREETSTAGRTASVYDKDTVTLTLLKDSSSSSSVRKVIPDARSDIYSVGATLYHLLSGQRPSSDALKVVPLSKEEYSPQIVKIITKAMNPNPDLRYQTAEEMLYEFTHLRENDPRVIRQKRRNIAAGLALGILFAGGAVTSFVGLKGMQETEKQLKMAEYAQNALEDGDTGKAKEYALDALGERKSGYMAEAESALAEAMGVYDLSDGFKAYKTLTLPSAPLFMKISPDGETAVVIYEKTLEVFDTDTAEILVTLPAEDSALSEAAFLNDTQIVYAGDKGLTAYDFEEKKELWTGEPATAVKVSGDGQTVAAVYREDNHAVIYHAADGSKQKTVEFGERHQDVTVNDSFANPNDNLLALNQDGSLLSVSFADGSLQVYDLNGNDKDMELLEDRSGYTHFEGGFFRQYFAFAASKEEESVFAIIDTEKQEQTGGFESESPFGVQTDENGIYVQSDDILVKIHPVSGEQTPLVTTSETIHRFAVGASHTLIASKNKIMYFDENAKLIAERKMKDSGDFVQINAGIALIGSMDSPVIRIMQYEDHADAEVFAYDPSYEHDEARLSADRKTVMLFSYDQFRVFDVSGSLICEKEIPDADQVYDQQFIRDGAESLLEVIYNDGRRVFYSAGDGSLVKEEIGEDNDRSLDEEFVTDAVRIESPLHGTPVAYDARSGKKIRELEKDAYLTYVTQAGNFIITQYITADGYYYGLLLNEKCETLAELPYLCDVINEELIFDYPTGNMRKTSIYHIEALISKAKNESLQGGN